MLKCFALDGVEYAADDLEESGRAILEKLTIVQTHIATLENMQALLIKAKNAYISDIKAEIIKNRTGVDLSALFDAE